MPRAKERLKTIYLQLAVTVPESADCAAVITAINEALDEPPCSWGEWIVGEVTEAEE